MASGPLSFEENELLKDAKYRNYVSAIDKVLKLFDNSSEWADLIPALGKLNKIICNHTKYPVIPRSILISTRLAQCMNYKLPSGVNLKALEIYDVIFKNMGTNRLARDLFIYSTGLFPLLVNSSLTVRPVLLTIYETHFVPLGKRLRPALSGFLLGILPGLDINSEYSNRTNKIVEKVCEEVGNEYFYSCLWQIIVTNSNIRLSGFNYLLNHFNKQILLVKQQYILGSDLDLFVTGLCYGIQDSNILVQRTALDFLLITVPIKNFYLSKKHTIDLIKASVTILLRRDVSLTRRLYSWLLDSDKLIDDIDDDEKTNKTLDENIQEMLLEAIRSLLKDNSKCSETNIFKLLAMIVDRIELQHLLLNHIALDVFRLAYCLNKNIQENKLTTVEEKREQQMDLKRNLNYLCNSLETNFVWTFMKKQFELYLKNKSIFEGVIESETETDFKIGLDSTTIFELCALINFLIEIIPNDLYTFNTSDILPNLFISLIHSMDQFVDRLMCMEIVKILELQLKILNKIQPITIQKPKEMQVTDNAKSYYNLEKSKSDSKLNESGDSRNSNDHFEEKIKTADLKIIPTSKSKSSSRIDDLIKGEQSTDILSDDDISNMIENEILTNNIDENQNEKIRRPESVIENESILKCFEIYKKFFVNFTVKKVLPKSINTEEYFSVLLKSKNFGLNRSNVGDLETILKYYIETNNKHNPYLKTSSRQVSEFGPDINDLRFNLNNEENLFYNHSMISVLNLLFEFNSFSNLIHFDSDEIIVHLPKWLKVLIIIACYENGRNENQHDTQICAINIVLKIIGLVKEQNFDYFSTNRKPSTNFVIMGVLKKEYVHFIEKFTFVIEILSQILWKFLGVFKVQKHVVTCVNLLYFINNVFPNENFAEKIINNFLIQDALSVESFKKFSILWYLGKSIDSNSMFRRKSIKHFDRCLLRVLDNLQQSSEKSVLKVFTEELVIQSLLRNDIVRIIHPILMILLSPSTARVSINHFNLEKSVSKNDFQDDSLKKDDPKLVDDKSKLFENNYQLPKYNKIKNLLFGRSPKKERKAINPPPNTPTSIIAPLTPLNEFNNEISDTGNSTSDVILSTISTATTLPIDVPNFKEVYSDGAQATPTVSIKSKEDEFVAKNDDDISNTSDANIVELPSDKMLNEIQALESSISSDSTNGLNEGDSDTSQMSDCEMSATAEDFFTSSTSGVHRSSKVTIEEVKDISEGVDHISVQTTGNHISVHLMHSHMLLYGDIFDTGIILYALKTLKSCICVNQKLFIHNLTTINLQNSIKNSEILCSLARHQKAKQGLGYFGDLDLENVTPFRGSMFLEVIVIICLNYASSFFAIVDNAKLTDEIKENNLKIQLLSLEILDIIVRNLTNLVHESNESFSRYAASLLRKTDFQKTALQILITSVRDFDSDASLPEEVLKFNGFRLFNNEFRITEYVEAAQKQLLRLVQALIILEYQVCVTEENESKPISKNSTVLISEQPMFLSAILSALRQVKIRNLHQNWCNMITTSLAYLSKNLKQIAINTVQQLCLNIENNTNEFLKNNPSHQTSLIPDYLMSQIDCLTSICHFCLLDTPQFFMRKHSINSSMVTTHSTIMNILSAFVPSTLSGSSTEMNNSNSSNLTSLKKNYPDFYLVTRNALLNQISRIISSLLDLWRICYDHTESLTAAHDDFYSVLDNEKLIKQQILDLLNPLVVHHSSHFIAAIAIVWYDKKSTNVLIQKNLMKMNECQDSLTKLLLGIKVLPLENLLNMCLNLIRYPLSNLTLPNDFNINIVLFEVIYCYLSHCSSAQLLECWQPLFNLIRESYNLNYNAQIIVFLILNDVISKCCPLSDKKEQKDLQDNTIKIVECLSQISGSGLEQTTWLRKNLSVREQDTESVSLVPSKTPSLDQTIINFSLEAQNVLADNLAVMIDICFGSQEKEKVTYMLTQLMGNVIPYLKYHSNKNLPSFAACSKLIASLSSYQYTRKIWKKDVFDLLMDFNFFQTDFQSLSFWKIIVDNLMTQDTTFRDLMGRVSLSQNVGLNLFSSKDQEYEQRAQMLKRLSFVIYCGEMDQYAKYIPDIQEQLKISLKLCVPNVLVQVFYCYRILLLRISGFHVTHLWPFIIAEMLQILLLIEKELEYDSDDYNFYIKTMSGMDPNWTVSASSSLQSNDKVHWLSLQLVTAKLLDITLLLPTTTLPQFQVYRWAFISESSYEDKQMTETFVPYIKRISNLMDLKYGSIETEFVTPGQLLINRNQIDSLNDLQWFFKQLSQVSKMQYSINFQNAQSKTEFLKVIDDVVGADFLDSFK